MEMRVGDRNLRDVVEVLASRNIVYFLNEGTLLGLIRDGELIEWDLDVDISLLNSEDLSDGLVDAFQSLGFDTQFGALRRPGFPPLKLFRAGGRVVDIAVYERATFAGQAFRAHLWFASDKFRPTDIRSKLRLLVLRGLHRLAFRARFGFLRRKKSMKFLGTYFRVVHDALSSTWGMDEVVGYFIPSELLTEMVYVDFGGTKFSIPLKAEEVLSSLYGFNWREPKRANRWTDFFREPPLK